MITIITPSYNASEHLQSQYVRMKYLLSDDVKWIIVDDCSQDDTAKIVESLECKYITYARLSKNSGPSIARFEGVKLAETDLVFFLDADDYLYNDNFLRLCEFVRKNEADYYYGTACISCDIAKVPQQKKNIPEKSVIIKKPTDFLHSGMPNYSSLLINRKFFLNFILINQLEWGEDIASYMSMADKGIGIKWGGVVSCYIITGHGRGSSLVWHKRFSLFKHLIMQSVSSNKKINCMFFSVFLIARFTASYMYKKMVK
ncbi:glycosyltransferase family 2 protein [Dryocola sp. BD626]|uniref:glycosyltransferase family 2 protein n=1 Tax=Dryocola sp. BD626 TaxID=3133273 RepID=UPI003F4FAB0B